MLREVILDTLLDSARLLPFLFVAYLAIELLEHYAGDKTDRLMQRAGRYGPVVGALVGVVPQCGFSTVAANLYAGGVVSLGTLLAVFLSTSDEMLPVMISRQAPVGLILKILGFKIVAAVLTGFVVDLVWRRRGQHPAHIHELCEHEGCHCEDGVLKSALRHTVKIFLFLLVIMFAVSLAVAYIGTDALAGLVLNRPVIGPLLAGLVGLIPNCAGSVLITELYLQGGMQAGAMLSGLMVSAGVGVLVLCRMNHNWRENLAIIGLLYGVSVVFGCVAGMLPIF